MNGYISEKDSLSWNVKIKLSETNLFSSISRDITILNNSNNKLIIYREIVNIWKEIKKKKNTNLKEDKTSKKKKKKENMCLHNVLILMYKLKKRHKKANKKSTNKLWTRLF